MTIKNKYTSTLKESRSMKKTVLTLLLLFGISNIALSIINPDLSAGSNKKDALQIRLPGIKDADGMFSPEKLYVIPRLDQQHYLRNTIHIKTKNHLNLVKGKYAELSPTIQSATSGLSIKTVRAPFAEFSEYKMLSKDKYGVGRIYEIVYQNPIDPYDACRELMNNPDIEYAVPVFVRMPYYTPNDPQIGSQYYLTKLEATKAWDISKGSQEIKIAIVDSGTDWTHEDLAGNLWTNPNEVQGNGTDDDGNGKIDDFRGWDLVGNISANEAYASQWKEDNDPKPVLTNNTHGTHVAGCANAVSNNGKGIASLGMNCVFIPVKCGADNGSVRGIYRGYEGIMYAARLGADVINCSWGGPGSSPAEQDIINQAVEMGSVVIVAAGNETSNVDDGSHFPSGYDNVVSVGATNSSDKPAWFTNYGYTTTIYAPGAGILSTINGNKYENQDGTSMASPVAAGLTALVRSVFPNYTPKQVLHQLRSTCQDVLGQGANRPMYYGRVNAYRALTYNNPQYPDRKVPGCEISEIKIGDNDKLTNTSPQNVKVKLDNYLSPTSSNFKVTITPLDYFIKVNDPSLNVGEIGTLASKELTFGVQLSQDNPWYNGYAKLLIKYEDGDYIDYQMIKLPVVVNSTNTFISHISFPDYYEIRLNAIHSPSKNIVWGGGTYQYYYGLYYTQSAAGKFYNYVSQNPVSAVYGFNENKAILGASSSSGSAQLYTTVNGGSNWTSRDISSLTTFVNDIHFFSETNGVFIGDPVSSSWGVANTADGGSTWIRNTSIGSAYSGETQLAGAMAVYKDNIWFGSSIGRLYRSTNKGQSWTSYNPVSGSTIYNVAFASKDSGMIIYGSASATNDRLVATTLNGGVNWTTNVFSFASKNVAPVKLYSPAGTGIFLAVCKNGEIFVSHDMGKAWLPVLSKSNPSVNTAAGVFESGKVRLWMAGAGVASVDFDVPKANVSRLLSFGSLSEFTFDSVKVGSSKIENITLYNNGNTRTVIEKIEFIPGEGTDANDFKTSIGTSSAVESEATGTVRVRFAPTSAGNKSAIMRITSDANPTVTDFQLYGKGYAEATNKTLSTLGTTELEFDSVLVGLAKTLKFKIKNTGNSAVSLALSILGNSPDFSIKSTNIPSQLSAGAEIEVEIEFSPKSFGEITNTLLINNDGDPSEISIALSGIGVDPTGISDESGFSVGNVSPNPSATDALVVLSLEDGSYVRATVIDLSGKELLDIFSGYAYKGENLLLVPARDLTAGTYFLKIESMGKVVTRKFVVE